MALDYDQKLDIDIETEKIDISTLPDNIKETRRFLLKFLVVDPYKIDGNINIYLNYKQFNNDTEFGLNYVIKKEDTRFKQKLPPGINVREFYVKIIGTNLTQAEIGKISVLSITRRIGNR